MLRLARNDPARLLLDEVFALVLKLKQLHGVHDWGKRVAELVAQHGQELILAPVQVGEFSRVLLCLLLQQAAIADVTNVALRNPLLSDGIHVAHELHFYPLAACRLEG